MATVIAFGAGALAIGTLLILLLAGLVHPKFRFWPPPGKPSWQYRVFWWLFRAYLISICILTFLELQDGAGGRFFVAGWLLFFTGFGLATLITISLGWRNAHGEAVELQTAGWFAYSRNPVYMVSILGMAGLWLAIESGMLRSLLSAWALIYVLAPFLEEPWLQKQFGESYNEYCNRVPRFIGRRRGI